MFVHKVTLKSCIPGLVFLGQKLTIEFWFCCCIGNFGWHAGRLFWSPGNWSQKWSTTDVSHKPETFLGVVRVCDLHPLSVVTLFLVTGGGWSLLGVDSPRPMVFGHWLGEAHIAEDGLYCEAVL